MTNELGTALEVWNKPLSGKGGYVVLSAASSKSRLPGALIFYLLPRLQAWPLGNTP